MNVGNSFIEDGVEYPIISTRTKGLTDKYISIFAYDPEDSNRIDSGGKNYAVTAGVYQIAPPAGEIWQIARLVYYIEDVGSFDSGGFGNGAALTNGIILKVENATTVLNVLTAGLPIKKNTHWRRFCFDLEIDTFGLGNESMASRWSFFKSGAYLKLNGDNGEKITVTLNDDFSGIVSQTFLFQGFKE